MALKLTIFISCPGDLKKEKQILHDVAKRITDNISDTKCDVVILVKDWFSIIGKYGLRPQEIINLQFNSYDIYLGMWWMRFGSNTGAIDPKTGKEYESGTYEEFAIAKQRWELKKDLQIYLFFKDPVATKDSELNKQYQKVLDVREAESKSNWVNEFIDETDFERKITHLLYSHAINLCMGSKESSIPEPTNEVIAKYVTFINSIKQPLENYIPRQLISSVSRKIKSKTFVKQPTSSLQELIYTQKKIVLLGDAGSGKSTELRHLFNYYCAPNSSFYPIFQRLSLYTSELGLDKFLPDFWREIHPSKLIIIWDGLDEISPTNFQTVLKQISNFSNNNPDLRIVISSRTNFYEIPSTDNVGSLEQFQPYYISEFGNNEIKSYLDYIKAPYSSKDFIKEAYDNNYADLASKPFFLPILSSAYSKDGNLLIKRSILFEDLLIANLKADNIHYKGTYDFDTNTKNILLLLQKVALSMEIMCKNSISTQELKEIVSTDELNVLKYCGIFNLSGIDESIWQFQHNNLQEYLAARAISSLPFKDVIELISVGPTISKLIPSWVNTLTFLFSILEPSDPLFNNLLNWLLDNDKEAIVKFEKDKIPVATRVQIFENIFEFYKERNVWLRSNKFNDIDLARFSQSEQSIKYLLAQLSSSNSNTIKANAIGILGHYDYSKSKLGTQVKKALIKIATTPLKDYQFLYTIIYSLSFSGLMNLNDLKKLVKKIGHIKNQYVRSPIYSIINKLNSQDDFIDYLIEGYDLANSDVKNSERDDISLFGESFGIEEAFKEISAERPLSKLVDYLNKNTDHSLRSKHEIIESVLATSAKNYSPSSRVHKSIIEWFLKLIEGFRLDKLPPLVDYFNQTNTSSELFNYFWSLSIEPHKKSIALAYLSSSDNLNFVVDKYNNREITKSDMLGFYYNLRSRNTEYFKEFIDLLKSKTDFEIPVDNIVDYEAIRKQRNQLSFDLLFDINKLLEETCKIFELEQTNQLTFDQLFDIRKINNREVDIEDRYPAIALEILRDFARNDKPAELVTVKKWFAKTEHVNWYCISKIYEYVQNTSVNVSAEQLTYISFWCNQNLSKVNYRTAITQKEAGSTSYNSRAIYIWYFFRKFNLSLPKNILLDMLSFDMFEKSEWVGIGYLSQYLSKAEITERIIQNLTIGISVSHVLLTHVKYACEKKLTIVYPIILKEIINTKHSTHDRHNMLLAYIEGTGDIVGVKKLLSKADIELYWYIIEVLFKASDNTFLVTHLSRKYKTFKNKPDTYKALQYLIRLQHLRSIELYTKLVRSKGKEFVKEISYNSIGSISTPKALPFLIELLKLTYIENFDTDRFDSYQTSILNAIQNISLISEADFFIVVEQLNKFIAKNKKLKNVNYLFHTIQRMEEKFYTNRVNSYTIEQVKQKLKLVSVN